MLYFALSGFDSTRSTPEAILNMSGSEMGFRPFDPESSFFSYPTSLHIGENHKQFKDSCVLCGVIKWFKEITPVGLWFRF